MITSPPSITPSRLLSVEARQKRLRAMVEAANKPVIRPINEHIFQRKLESHLYDVKMGNPLRTPSVHTELRQRHVDNRAILAGIEPKAMRMYMGLISGMDYRQQARLASNVFQMSKHLDELSTVDKRLAAIDQNQVTILERPLNSTD